MELADGQVVQPLTARQREVLRVIQQIFDALGEPPSVRYLGRRFGMDHRAVQCHLDALYRKGWLRAPSPGGIRCLHQPPT
jgi:SOS-response transcriptional repressor LexA